MVTVVGAGLVCRAIRHRWLPYGPSPKYQNYLPHVVRCSRCGRYQFADGQPLPPGQTGIRPYRPVAEGEVGGWTFYRPLNGPVGDGPAATDRST